MAPMVGASFYCRPRAQQKIKLLQWIGCSRFVWNAKCEENNYFYKFKQKFMPVNSYTPIDQRYAQFKSKELSPWLYDCPSQILRNTMATWRETMARFLKGECGRPRKKKKCDGGSIWLTSELFEFQLINNKKRLFIGTKTNNIGYLDFKAHRSFVEPQSIRIKYKNGKFKVSFSYAEESKSNNQLFQEDNLKYLREKSYPDLDAMTIGIDRGVAIPAHAGFAKFDFSAEQKNNKKEALLSIKTLQKKLSRQLKGSKRRLKTKNRLSSRHEKLANIRKDFAHKTSRALVNQEDIKVIVFEDLKTNNLVKAPKPKRDKSGKYIKNGSKAKAGLNQAILDKVFGLLELFCCYKAFKAGKAFFKVSAAYTSQECADCGYTHPDNRLSQAWFMCGRCGHTDNADRNSALVIKKRAINLILDSGTELSKRNVLIPNRYRTRSSHKTGEAKINSALGYEASKMTRPSSCGTVLEAQPL